MSLLTYIGIPFRFFLFCILNGLLAVVEPHSLKDSNEDWQWVITGLTRYRRNNGRQLL